MISNAEKMQILLDMQIPGLVQHDDERATVTHDGIVLNIHTPLKPDKWRAKVKGASYPLTDEKVPDSFREFVTGITRPYNLALMDADEGSEEEPEKNPLDNLEGFEGRPGSEEKPIVDSILEETLVNDDERAREYLEQKRQEEKTNPPSKKEVWSKPTPKKPSEKIPYNDGLEPAQLPAITGLDIVRPAVTASQALAAWKEFQELKKYIIESSDIQIINGKNHVKKSGWRKFATFYNLTDSIVDEIRSERDDLGKGAFQWKIKVICTAPNGRKTEGVAICTSIEKKFAHPEHDVYTTCHTRSKNRAISDMIAAGEVSAEEID